LGLGAITLIDFMKKVYLFLMKTVLVLGLVFAAGCSKDDNSVSDPEGTITVSMANSGVYDYNGYERGAGISFIGNQWVAIKTDNNFICQECTISNVGKVNGLGNINKIPNSGYTEYCSVEIHNGYVIQMYDGTYARLYVVDWVVSTYNAIIGAKVKYQYPFEP